MRARDDRRVAMASGPFWTDLKAALRRRYGLRKVLESAAGRLIRRATFFVAVGIVLLIAVALRLLNLDRFGFNSDEAVYAGQAAALAGHQDYAQLFGVFRAHPLLVHFIVSLVYRITGVNDVAPRLVSVAFGVGMVAVGGAIGTVMRGRRVGLLTMLIIAVSAYPVMVSRQLLLDGPMAFFFALTLLFLALYVRQPRGLTLYAAACSAGLAFLAKESAILMVPISPSRLSCIWPPSQPFPSPCWWAAAPGSHRSSSSGSCSAAPTTTRPSTCRSSPASAYQWWRWQWSDLSSP